MTKLHWLVLVEVVCLFIGAMFFVHINKTDWLVYYQPFAGGCLHCGFVPFYARWFLAFFSIFDAETSYKILMVVTIITIITACYINKTNPLYVILSFAFLCQFWLGQIDFLIIIGFILLLNKHWQLQTIGVCFLMVKPQITLIPLLWFFITKKDLKLLIAPAMMLFVSFMVFGLFWPLEWYQITRNLPDHLYRFYGKDVWFLGLSLIWLPIIFKNEKQRFNVSLIISFLMPFTGFYSFIVLLVHNKHLQPLILFLGYIPIILYPFIGETAARFAWLVPVTLLAYNIFHKEEIC